MITPHKCLKKLEWLIGHWKSEKAVIKGCGNKTFSYLSEFKCETVGQPNLIFHINGFNVQPLDASDTDTSTTLQWPNELKPFHREMGFLRVNPQDENDMRLSYLNSQNVGITCTEEGEIDSSKKKFTLETKTIERSCFAKEPRVVKLKREYLLNENDNNVLNVTVHMKTSKMNDNDEPYEHLVIKYRKTSD
ncbi:unnamed protein product [Didymodactylos carnosus]|uniref:THAP4-like heme-binding domain-containing protein n=1 Tax=Didymodactylos carnosus TaxID=1234261 RepID=A0A814D225_9BILA|nr:unnamed protein product [Didymodactylos carnosus]CAF1325489.1 unnamed protein product [Didymodactylos carnosus]CAF3723415.1 unnamed protein product [Didymodactylos carnosus]CAF4136516.1 unnamed protein product [Didymodactylos carnosus]